MDKTELTSALSEASSETSSPFFRRRFDGKTTRREAIEHRFGKGRSPVASRASNSVKSVLAGPQIPDPTDHIRRNEPQSPPKLFPKTAPRREHNYIFEEQASVQTKEKDLAFQPLEMPDSNTQGCDQHIPVQHSTSRPLHLEHTDSEIQYYRVVYRGVVSLLSHPSFYSPRSGAYVSYGEVIASTAELVVRDTDSIAPATPTRNPPTKPIASSPSRATQSVANRKMIRVDRVLTGGYSVDASEAPVEASDQTPRRDNTHSTLSIVGSSPLPLYERLPQPSEDSQDEHSHGYIFSYRKDVPVLVRIIQPPRCESGHFVYKVVSSTPLAVYTGPRDDAPRTRGMLVPGTIHEVCLRVVESSICWLRLTRRRGWVADRISARGTQTLTGVTVMQEVTDHGIGEDCSKSLASFTASSVATPVSSAQRRHRPPRRRREIQKVTIESTSIPKQVAGMPNLTQSRNDPNASFDTQMSQSHDRSMMSPLSNISMLSDESSLDHSIARHALISTPDRSASKNTPSSVQPSFFLMRVNAPWGLKILDAPHFQVNNLIHGAHGSGSSVVTSPSKDTQGQTSHQSIFQTMGGHHTTTLTSKAGNPAVFDSNTKARKLPRGSVFEASKRMEAAGAFSQGSGLIKLSDNSGWAIVPKMEELSQQYRNYTGSLVGIKEGEASRAFDEIGNAVVDENQSPVYIRILNRGGLVVSLPPPSTVSDDETSPTSSAGGSSAVSGYAGSGQMGTQDSDVASSVGSSFLDAMFRTPRKKDSDVQGTDGRRDHVPIPSIPKVPSMEKNTFSVVLPCGSYVEAERWISPPDKSPQTQHLTEFARLRGGQGWIPRYMNGKAVTEIISQPETRFGSFWFRVQDQNGIKVRLGPSRRAPSIKSDDGVYFRFECGEYLRASEVITFFRQSVPCESYAKLYRNRHVRLYAGHGIRPLSSLTAQAEWVEVFSSQDLYLEECAAEPRIERHRQGWRYNVVLDSQVYVRKGPSFESAPTGATLLGGESVLVHERVTGPDDSTTWLRLKDGQGWVHNVGPQGEVLMIPHSLRHRKGPPGRPTKPGRDGHDDIAYNAIIARLFHSNVPEESNNARQEQSRRRWN